MKSFKRFNDIFGELDNLFPGIIKNALSGLIDPSYARNEEDLSKLVEYNICLLKKKLTCASSENSGVVKSAACFMENPRNFSQEQWQVIQKLKCDLCEFGVVLGECMQGIPSEIGKNLTSVREDKKTQRKKSRRGRCDWTRA
ncbi:hypothetical protein [Candidatus Similichlamydia epinepheli]|uniref:hypothetical protein n=1 Tax=Candidatus Similichlamydia epinepheli TaxID=1903953 RepID=UPI000D3A270F|nr:hypothetical protein [Candidatus Similichlamydia epinepheli]